MKKKDVLKVPAWLAGMSGREQEVVLSSGIKVIRNIAGYPMPNHASLEQLGNIKNKLRAVMEQEPLKTRFNLWDFGKLDELERGVLYEKHAAPFLKDSDREILLYTDEDFAMRVLINHKEHLQFGNIAAGLVLPELHAEVTVLEEQFAKQVEFAFSERYGYLAGNVLKSGSGLVASVVLHLPALIGMEKVEKLEEAVKLKKMSLVRLYKDETPFALGNLYMLSNEPTMNESEAETIDKVMRVAQEICERELKMRKVLQSRARLHVENYVWGAVGILQNTRMMQAAEMLAMFSYIALGIDLGLLEKISWGTLKQLMVQGRSSHLKMIYPGKDIEQVRASLLRNAFKEV